MVGAWIMHTHILIILGRGQWPNNAKLMLQYSLLTAYIIDLLLVMELRLSLLLTLTHKMQLNNPRNHWCKRPELSEYSFNECFAYCLYSPSVLNLKVLKLMHDINLQNSLNLKQTLLIWTRTENCINITHQTYINSLTTFVSHKNKQKMYS